MLFHHSAFGVVAVVGEFYHLAACDVAAVEGESDEGAHLLPSLLAGGTRIDGEQTQTAVRDDLEDVTVSAHEDFGLRQFQSRLDARRVSPWVSANVCHDHLYPFHSEYLGLLVESSQFGPINVAIHCSNLGPNGLQHRHERGVANVACMPYLVAVGKMLGIPVVPVAMSVAYYT